MEKTILLIISILLASCAGGVSPKANSFIPELDSDESVSGKIFILVDTYTGRSLLDLRINGDQKRLRSGQVFIADAFESDNVISVNYFSKTGLGNLFTPNAKITFNSDGSQNHYLIITQTVFSAPFTSPYSINQVSEQTFRNTRQKKGQR